MVYEELQSDNQELTFKSFADEFQKADIQIDDELRIHFGLIKEDGTYTNLGKLVSDQCTHTIKLAVFEGNRKEILKERYEFEGSLFTQTRECFSYLDRFNRTSSAFDDLTHTDQRDYAAIALKEALINCIVHRDYAFNGSTLINIFDGYIEFINLGGPVCGLTKEDILLGVSISRNKRLANLFSKLGLMDAYGTGIPKIVGSYYDYECKPKIEVTQNAFKVTLYSMINPNKNDLVSPNLKQDLSDNERRIFTLFKTQNTIKRSDVESLLCISQPMAVHHLNALLEKNVLVKVGNGKNTHYKQK